MAPVTGSVSDAEQNRLVVANGSLERIGAPCPPVHGVVRMLKQIGTRFVCEAIGHCEIIAGPSSFGLRRSVPSSHPRKLAFRDPASSSTPRQTASDPVG